MSRGRRSSALCSRSFNSFSIACLEIGAEGVPRVVQLALGGSGVDAGDLADLFVRVTVDLVKHEHLSRRERDRGDRALDVDRLARSDVALRFALRVAEPR